MLGSEKTRAWFQPQDLNLEMKEVHLALQQMTLVLYLLSHSSVDTSVSGSGDKPFQDGNT